MSGGISLQPLLTKEYWEQQYKERFEEISREASWRISNISNVIGSHNYGARILDMYCGLGAMVEKMTDGGFLEVYGIDPEESLKSLWFHKDHLSVIDPINTEFPDGSFDLVTCFGGFDRTDEHDELLSEMKRLTTGTIIIRPYDQTSFELQKKTLPLLLKHRIGMVKYNPVHGYLTCVKEV